MVDVIIRFFTFDVISTHPLVYWALGGVWLVLVTASFLSLANLTSPFPVRLLWGLLIVLLPLLGLLIYAFRCLFCGDWTFLKPLFPQNKFQGKNRLK